MGGLNVLTYLDLMKGAKDEVVIVAGDPESSNLYLIQMGAKKHFGQFTPDQLELIKQWILAGALEK